MEEKLLKLYNDCLDELESIGIIVRNNKNIGEIEIGFSKRNAKRYGCCKQENPDKSTVHKVRKGRRIYISYDSFFKHKIEISRWVMDLDDDIIKNTIMHELIHCFPGCNNHGATFKKYAKYISQNLGYNISRTGNKEEDYKKSNVEFSENKQTYKYKIICQKCGHVYYRQRIRKNLIRNYRCSICGGKLTLESI